MNVPYVVSFDNPPPSIPEMAYWERVTVEEEESLEGRDIMSVALQIADNALAKEPAMSRGGWRLRWKNGEFTDAIPDGETFDVRGTFDFIRKTLPSGELIAIPTPRPFTQGSTVPDAKAVTGELIQLEPTLDSLMTSYRRGDSLYVLVPSKLWPDFAEHPLARAVYDVCAGIKDEEEEPHTWAELRDSPAPQEVSNNLWVIRRHDDEESESYRTSEHNPPPQMPLVAYWERGVKVEGCTSTKVWLGIDYLGDDIHTVTDGTYYTVEAPRAVYEFNVEQCGTTIAIARPRYYSEAKAAASLLGSVVMLRPSMAKFCIECKNEATQYIMVGRALWSKLVTNKKVMHDFVPAPCKDQVLNGLMGEYMGVPVWSDMYAPPEEKTFGAKLWVCRTRTQQ